MAAFAKLSLHDQGAVDEVFLLYDIDRSSSLKYDSFVRALEALGHPRDKARFASLMRQHGTPPPNWRETAVDPDAPCHVARMTLSKTKFRQVAAEFLEARDPNAAADQAFDLLDLGGKGLITADDLAASAREVGMSKTPQELEAMIALYDHDGKGGVDREEFRLFYREELARQQATK